MTHKSSKKTHKSSKMSANSNVSFFAGNRRKSIKLNGKTYQLFIASSGGAYVLVNGEVYDVIYLPLTCRIRPAPGTRNPRVTPIDAQRLPWKALKGAKTVQGSFLGWSMRAGSVIAVVNRSITIRLDFSRKFRYHYSCRYFSGERTSVFIALSDRKKRIRQNLISRMPIDALVTREVVEENDPACCVCFRNTQNAVFKPCGHGEICCACANAITRSTKICPLCRANVAYFARLMI